MSNIAVNHKPSMDLNRLPSTVDPVGEHPYMQNIRKAVLKYRLQSAAHFDLDVRVEQAPQSLPLRKGWATDPSFQIKVKFADYNGPETYTCRTKFRTNHNKNILVPTNRIMVVGTGRPTSLKNFLGTKFPSFEEEKISIDTVRAWWKENGRQFDWSRLPTELKELVVQNCLHQPISRGQYKETIRRHRSRFRPRSGIAREFGTFEIVDQLGDWASLLGVSHQIRAIALRLCFLGSSDMTYNKGFCIFTNSFKAFKDTINRLGRYYQMITANGLPIDEHSQALADCYKHYPKIYKDLDHYATFCHGIRRICMTMDFFGLMRFFKVTIGGFERYITPGSLSYEVFDQLPYLTEIAIELPGKPRNGWSNILCCGPILWHHDSPCPRTLHRLIYERIVASLTLYPSVIVQGLVDDDEKAHFNSLREVAMKKPKWTAKEYEELYAECGGGVQLDEAVVPGSWLTRAEEEDVPPMMGEEEEVTDDYFPPKCRCEEKCLVLFN